MLLALIVTAMAAPFAGPLSSGALLLLLPADVKPILEDLPESYTPLHKGGIDLATGLYVREDEDLVLRETPHLVLRRTYLSGYHVNRQFGIGTTHNGERALVGDGEGFQWAKLFPASGARVVNFERVSPGRWFVNALYEHRETSSEYSGARLGWIGLGWAMRLGDGTRLRFRACTPRMPGCSIVEERDAAGSAIHYRRNAAGRLLRMEASPNRWIAFDYDPHGRITRAHDSAGREVRYEYDGGGRLSLASASDGTVRRYAYTNGNRMRTIEDPDIVIENTYDADGRCIRQVNRFPGEPEPYTFDFIYKTRGDSVASAEVRRSDTTWTIYTFNGNLDVASEAWGSRGSKPVSVTYERDPRTRVVTRVTVTCTDRTGRPLPHARRVTDGAWQWHRDDVISAHCSSGWSSRSREIR